jgi:histone H3/H4
MLCTPILRFGVGDGSLRFRENTATLRDMGLGRGRFSLASGRDSDIRPAVLPEDDTENTFVFTVPPRDALDPEQSDDVAGDPVDDAADDALESPSEDDNEDNDRSQMVMVEAEDAEAFNNPMEGDADTNIPNNTLQDFDTSIAEPRKSTKKKRVKISKHGIQYPSLPQGVVKKLANTYARTSGNSKAKISKDTLDAIMQASDWFFEQVSDDLGAYANHAGRKTIEESDVVTLMKRYVLSLQ